MAEIDDLLSQLNGSGGESNTLLAELNDGDYRPPAAIEARPGKMWGDWLYENAGVIPRAIHTGGAMVGLAIETPVLRMMGRGDIVDRDRRAFENFREYNRELDKNSVFGATVGPVVGNVAEMLTAGTLAAYAGGGTLAAEASTAQVAAHATRSLASTSVMFGIDGADRVYVQARDQGLPEKNAAMAATRQFLVDGVGTFVGGKAVQALGYNPGRYFGETIARTADKVAERSGLKQLLGSALLDSGVNGLQGAAAYMNGAYSGLHEFDWDEFTTAAGSSAALGGALGAATSSFGLAAKKFQADLPKAMKGVEAANAFMATATPEQKAAVAAAKTTKELKEATGQAGVSSTAFRESFLDELSALQSLETELAAKGVSIARDAETELSAIASRRVELEKDSAELEGLGKELNDVLNYSAKRAIGGDKAEGLHSQGKTKKRIAPVKMPDRAPIIPEGFAEKRAEIEQMRRAIDAEKELLVEREQMALTRKAAGEGEIAEHRAYLESELNRIAAEEKKGAELPGKQKIESAPQAIIPPEQAPPKKIWQQYEELEYNRMAAVDVIANAERGAMPDATARQDLAALVSTRVADRQTQIALSNELAQATTPQQMQQAIGKLLTEIDASELQLAKEDYQTALDGAKLLRPEFADQLKQVRGQVGSDVNSLKAGADLVRELTYQSEMADTFILDPEHTVSEAAAGVSQEVALRPAREMKSDSLLNNLKAKVGLTPATADDGRTITSVLAHEFAERPEETFSNLSPQLANRIYHGGRKARRDFELRQKHTKGTVDTAFNNVGLTTELTTEGVTPRELRGSTPRDRWREARRDVAGVNMSRGEAFWLVLGSLDPRHAKNLETYGYQFEAGNRKLPPVDDKIMNELYDFVGPEGQQVAQQIFDHGNSYIIDGVNSAVQSVTGRPLTRNRNVVPMFMADDQHAVLTKRGWEGTKAAAVDSYGHLRRREGIGKLQTMPKGMDGITMIMRHFDRMNRVSAYMPYARDAEMLLNRPEVKAAIVEKNGPSGYEYLVDTVKNETTGFQPADRIGQKIASRSSAAAGAVLNLKLSVMAKNVIDPIVASGHDAGGYGHLMQGMRELASRGPTVVYNEMLDFLPQFSGEWNHRFEAGEYVGEITSGIGVQQDYFRPPSLVQRTSGITQAVEQRLAALPNYVAAKAKAREAFGGDLFDDPAWRDMVVDEWELRTVRGSNSSHPMELSGSLQYARKNPIASLATTFYNQAAKVYSLAAKAEGAAKQGQYRAAAQYAATFLTAAIAEAGINTAMTTSERDKKHAFMERWVANTAEGMVGTYPVAGREVGNLVSKYMGMPNYQHSPIMLLDQFTSIAENSTALADDISRGVAEARVPEEALDNLLGLGYSLGPVLGAPTPGLIDIGKRLDAGTPFPGLSD